MYTLDEVKNYCEHCSKCPLHETRNRLVFGNGNQNADIFFIGEGPGYYEDQSGRTFVGKAGILLEKALKGIELTREDVYIGNIVKCRPPGNRNPLEEEMLSCMPYLRYQVAIIKPRIIVCLGSVSAKKIIGDHIRITADRGHWVEKSGIFIMPTFHPAAVLRDQNKKRPFWEDFIQIKRKLVQMNSEDAL